MVFSLEQAKYIEYPNREHTKLIACAGSGKTKCIVHKIDYLIKNSIYDRDSILMLTFSRFTKNDFIRKIKDENITTINRQNIRTIDSFAKYVIDKDNSIDVKILSYTFMKYLQDSTIDELKDNDKLNCIKTVFVDEAQDLNEVQFTVLSLLDKKLNCTVNLIGDPNQNIFQFRKSSDKYLIRFKAKTFYLTKNFRSYEHIVDFCKFLRPYNSIDVTAHKIFNSKNTYNKNKTMFFTFSNNDFIQKQVTTIINNIKSHNIDISTIAILAPTRGYIKNNKAKGLAFVSNMLAHRNIPFKAFYDETNDSESGQKIKYEPEKGYVNVLTYTGSKGLEWDYVILIDPHFGLTNQKLINEQKHLEDQYLLYVACSRAIKRLFIVSSFRYYFTPKYKKIMCNKLNPWFRNIPEQYYNLDPYTQKYFGFSDQDYIYKTCTINVVTDIISKLSEEELYNINKMFILDTKTTQIFSDYRYILKNNCESFLSEFTKFLFHYQYSREFAKPLQYQEYLYNIVHSKHIKMCNDDITIKWFYQNRSITWSCYDKIKYLLIDSISTYIDTLSRTIELNRYILINNKFYDHFIAKNISTIREHYKNYCNRLHWRANIESIFYLQILLYSIKTCHYYHVENNGYKFRFILNKFKNMFGDIYEYILKLKKDNNDPFPQHSVMVEQHSILGEIDLIDNSGNIYEIKCINSINLTHILQLLMYNHLYHNRQDPIIEYKFFIVNFLEGVKHEYNLIITQRNMNKIVNLFQNINKN